MTRSKPKYTIALTGLNAIDNPGSGIAVIRGLREAQAFDVKIVGLCYENLEPGIYMRDLVDKVYQIPYPSMGCETLLSRIEYIHHRAQIDVIIPNFDAELYSFIRLAPRLRQMGIQSLLPTVKQFDARLKGNLNQFGAQYGISVPKSLAVFNIAELEGSLAELDYPIMIKGKFYEAFVAYSLEQARAYYYKLTAKWGTPIILQQYIKGQEYNITALGDGKGRLLGAVPMRKTYITETGKAWAGISIDDPQLLEMAQSIVEKTAWGGGLELELIKEDETNRTYLIEINPRFPAWIYLAVGCGQNHPEALVRTAMGEELESFSDYTVGKMFIRYSYDMICDLADFQKIAIEGEL
ncbi:MAG: ATP-grasp domain-containing protein [Saprospiraceae bacterium]|nr:ATP-grasp domain-containing protein [Saprospiraceae bacterium]